ncbi:uncharacterized protein LOC107670587 [Sinocyclocheilus anshuiensis]|uniref:uncharacterized protein LOC107670587 n=1 Tax=Sinocyclocheilus anshuiensis TaxID=1608454 RepID=UPI0007B9AFC2|nr:PREDICTED: uncharacterized protein LOC107670587 [Sinocyclocheilus anshuiensis]
MLQQNNNNNCLDIAHRELLHECRRTNVSFTSALEFGAIPLIKGLRAWAVSGGYSKARRKAANGPRAQGTCQQPPENRVGQRSWSGQVSSGYGHTLDSTISATRTPGVRQGSLGALVTVATLKGTDGGGRQTQTRCLFLKAQGRGSYICAVGNRGTGTRVTGPRTHTVILEGTKEELRCSSKGPKLSQDGPDDGGLFKAKPRAIRKWRKCSKTTGLAEKRTAAHGKAEIANQGGQPKHGDQKKAVISDAQPLNVIPDNIITQCQKGSSASYPLEVTISLKLGKDERAHSHISVKTDAPESTDPQTCCSSAKPCAKPGEQVEAGMSINQSDNCSEKESSCANGDAHGDTEVNKCDLDANNRQNIQNFVADVPNLGSSVASETNFDSLGIKLPTTNCNTEPSMDHSPMITPSKVPVSIQKNQEARPDECLLNRENLHSVEPGDLTTQRDGTPDTKNTVVPEGRTPVGVECSTKEKKRRPSMCSPQHWEELITEHGELEVQQSDKSSSRGFSAPTANITVTTIHSLVNPAPTTTAAIATAIPALSKGEVGARGGDLLPLVNSELLSEPARVDDKDKVAADEGSLDVGEEEEEDEFGTFMQAGGEQLWTDGFSEIQHLAEDCNCEEHTSSADANEPASWASDWTAVQSFQQSESTWTAFSQETVEQKIVHGGQWWTSTEKPNLPLSPLHNVSNVFLEAFPSEKSPCEDPEYIPTLKQFLQGPAENSNTGEHKEQSLLDGLQDLDRMIGVKYKRAESLSRKLLLQSLHLERPSSECVTVRLKTSARFSPNLPTSNQQLAANAKRRLSYDFNRNIMT